MDKYCLYNWTCIACTRTSKITCTACTCIPIGLALHVHVYKLDMYCLYILACQRLYFFFLDKSKFLGQVLHVQNSLYYFKYGQNSLYYFKYGHVRLVLGHLDKLFKMDKLACTCILVVSVY